MELKTKKSRGSCCVAPRCANTNGHVFPKDIDIRKKWIIAIKRDKWSPSERSVVCRAHFKDDDYISYTKLGKSEYFINLY